MEKRITTLEVIAEQTTKSIDRLDRSITELRAEINRTSSDLRADMRSDMRDMRTDMRDMRLDFDRKFMWVIGTQIGMLLAILGMMAKMTNMI